MSSSTSDESQRNSGGKNLVAYASDADVLYAVGDIHGCYDLAVRLTSDIAADIRKQPSGAKPVIIFCGDYVDRGPRSSDVISMLLWMERHAPCEVVFLKGNHEVMLLDFLESPSRASAWLKHGGEATLRSYGVDAVAGGSVEAQCEELRNAFLDRLPTSHFRFLQRLRTYYVTDHYIFVHAGMRPGLPIAEQSDDDLFWIRGDFLDSDHRFEKIVVHGHSWTSQEPSVTKTRIGVDTGAYHTGVLTAVRLTGAASAFLQVSTGNDEDASLSRTAAV